MAISAGQNGSEAAEAGQAQASGLAPILGQMQAARIAFRRRSEPVPFSIRAFEGLDFVQRQVAIMRGLKKLREEVGPEPVAQRFRALARAPREPVAGRMVCRPTDSASPAGCCQLPNRRQPFSRFHF